MKLLSSVLLIFMLCGCHTIPTATTPALSMPALFSDGMVLQQGRPVAIWGNAKPGTRVRIAMDGQRAEPMANEAGVWRAYLGPFKAGGPHDLRVRAGNARHVVRDVLIGEVWLCAGQSNMQMTMQPGPDAVLNVEQELAAANHPRMRLFTVPRATNFAPQSDLANAHWETCTPETVKTFSAAGYFFGRDVQAGIDVPIGLINASYGASPIEAWVSEDALRSLSEWRPIMDMLPRLIAESAKHATDYKNDYGNWSIQLDSFDEGYSDGKPHWADPALDDAAWATVNAPGYWEEQGFPTLDGFAWYRKVVEVPAAWAGKSLQLHLSGANDMHRAWFNGELVGSFEEMSGGFTLPRTYTISADKVRAGRNVVAVRVYDMGNVGGFMGAPADMHLDLEGGARADSIPLAGEWRFKPGMEIGKAPARPVPPVYVEGNQRIPAVLFNAMIAPIVPFSVRGVIWYQGESNIGRARQYEVLFPALINDWRSRFRQGDLPFLFVQLAGINPVATDPNAPSAIAELREAQARALSGPNTGMAVATDIGDVKSVHPRNKQEVGRRLALLALATVYGENNVANGPMYESMRLEGSNVRVRFNHAEGGLITQDGATPRGFAIAGDDAAFHWAEARIEEDDVVLSSKAVIAPRHVRYGWADNPGANLCNKANLPAAPFRSEHP